MHRALILPALLAAALSGCGAVQQSSSNFKGEQANVATLPIVAGQ